MTEKINTENSIEEINVESSTEFIETLLSRSFSTATESIFTPNRWVFRGIANSEWTLLPTALRGAQHGNLPPPPGRMSTPLGNLETTQIYTEYINLYKFYKQLEKNGLEIPDNSPKLREIFSHPTRLASFLYECGNNMNSNWPPAEIHGIMALAQHYKLSTRLLDWTFDPLIACYFSAKPSNSLNLAVWCLDTSTLSSEKLGTTLVYAAAASNQNLHAQKGLFTLSKVNFSDGNFGKVLDHRPLEERIHEIPTATDRPPLIKITLPRSKSNELKIKLKQIGYTTSKVFPGYQGIIDEMNEEIDLIDRKSNPFSNKYDCNIHVFIPEFIYKLGNSIAALVDPDVGGFRSFDSTRLRLNENESSTFRYCGGQIGRESLAYLLQDVAKNVPGVFYYISGGDEPKVFSTNIDGAIRYGESFDSLAEKIGLKIISQKEYLQSC